eukprot:423973-Amphidinium_carterae.1
MWCALEAVARMWCALEAVDLVRWQAYFNLALPVQPFPFPVRLPMPPSPILLLGIASEIIKDGGMA